MDPQFMMFVIIFIAFWVGVLLLVLLVLLITKMPSLIRYYVKSTGESARARILEIHFGRERVGEHSMHMLSQEVTLKLEVHPANGTPYVTEDKFWVKPVDLDLLRRSEGRDIQVSIARNNPKRVVCLPNTVTTSAYRP